MDLVNLVVVDSTVNTTSTSTKTSTATTKIKKIKTSKVKANSQKKSVVTATTTTTTTAATTNHCPTAINASQLVANKMAAIETVTSSSSEQIKISVKSSAATSTTTATATATANRIVTEISEKPTGPEKMASANPMAVDTATPATPPTTTATDGVNVNGLKKKSKKMKRLEAEKENISVRSSFSKFDALQKKNLIHVRSSDAGKIQEKLFDGGDISKVTKCAVCAKPVYKMEEIKAEKNIYHRNCFRCRECDKQLSVDTYQSHESVLYCKLHFKILFAPKVVEDSKLDKPRKPELIIRENQPDELPPDVVRASDKPNLGLEELQELNLRSKFQVFENSIEKQQQQPPALPVVTGVKRSTSIISKLAKLQSKGFITGLSADDMMIARQENSANKSNPDSGNDQSNDDDCDDENDNNSSDKSDDDDDDDDVDDVDGGGEETDLVRCRKRTQRERPVGLVGRAMSDIKTKFENGHIMSKEERREERKQELQNIRSRLFLGKQARIKEMYQQAVADSEQLVTSTGKKSEIEIGDKARSLKEKFEKGEIFRDHGSDKEENNNNNSDDADVFESAISKKSRSMFMELDASAIAEKTQLQQQQRQTMRRKSSICEQNDQDKHSIDSNGELTPTKTTKAFQQRQHQPSDNVVKHDEKTDDVQIETSEISSKFKFFETYRPTENQKKLFRITPPRDGVVKLPSPESDDGRSISPAATPAEPAEQIHTTTIMLNKFREMEESKKHRINEDYGPKPLKCFTPPPNDGRRNNQENDDDSNDDYSGEDDDDDDDDDDDSDDYAEDVNDKHIYDEALREAQLAARAKKLRDKFEKWEASEIQREMNDDAKFIYADQCADGSTIESTKLIRERFENLNNSQPNATARPRYKVNRFV